MVQKDGVLTKMLEYLTDARELLLADGSVQATVFASHDGGILLLPVLPAEDDSTDLALDLISKVLCAYDVQEYYVLSEIYHFIDGETLQECLSVLYTGAGTRVVVCPFTRVGNSSQFFFGEVSEIQSSNIEGSILDFIDLRDRTPKLSKQEKEHLRMLFPAKNESEISEDEYILH